MVCIWLTLLKFQVMFLVICGEGDMGCDGDLVMAGSIFVTLLVMKNVTGDGMDDDSGEKIRMMI